MTVPIANAPGLLFAPQARVALLHGVNCLADLVRPTLGPVSRYVAVANAFPNRAPELLDDGATILRRTIQLLDPYADMGAMLLRHTLWQMHRAVGDGTATTAVLMQSIVNQATRYLAAGGHVADLRRGLEQGLAVVLATLEQQARPLDSPTMIRRVAETLCHDPELAELLGEVFDIVGADGYVQVEKGHTRSLERYYVEGVHWNEGYVSPYFITDPPRQEARLQEPAILISDLRLTSADQLVPLLEQVAGTRRCSLLVIADEIAGSALGLLVANHQAGKLRLLAVRAPSHGTHRVGILEDLAVLTGGRVVTQAAGARAQNITPTDLGQARLAWASANAFGVVGGRGDPVKLRQRIATLRRELAATEERDDRDKLQERVSKLLGGAAILQVGAATQTELDTRKARAERAVKGLHLALAGGVLPGGGAALLACQPAVHALAASPVEQVGLEVLTRALEEPLRVIAANAGYEPATTVTQVKTCPPGWGFDVLTGQVVNTWEAGILDPAPVLTKALETAVSGAIMVLTTDVLVHHREPEMAFEP